MNKPKTRRKVATAAKPASKLPRKRSVGHSKAEPAASKRSGRREPTPASPLIPPQPKRPDSKQAQVLSLLGQPAGVTIDTMMQSTGWRRHSVRGFLAGVVRKKLGLHLLSAKDDSGSRVYRLVDQAAAATAAVVHRAPNRKASKAA